MSPTGNARSERPTPPEKIDLSDPAARVATAEQALADLRAGKISAAAATSIASLIRTATDNRLQELKTQLDDCLELLADIAKTHDIRQVHARLVERGIRA